MGEIYMIFLAGIPEAKKRPLRRPRRRREDIIRKDPRETV
jgi:hypothetical protein